MVSAGCVGFGRSGKARPRRTQLRANNGQLAGRRTSCTLRWSSLEGGPAHLSPGVSSRIRTRHNHCAHTS